MIAESVGQVFTESFINNLRMMAVEIANIVDKINELDTIKAAAFTVTTTATAGAAVATAAAGAITRATGGAPAAAAPAARTGPPPEIHVHLKIGDQDIAALVNEVKIEKYVAGKKSDAYASIVEMLKEGFLASS